MKNLLRYLNTVVVDGPKQYWAETASYVKELLSQRRLRHVVKMARLKTQADHKHRYVVKTAKGETIAVTSIQIETLRRKGILPKHINCLSIYKHAIEIVRYKQYHTHLKGSGTKVKEK